MKRYKLPVQAHIVKYLWYEYPNSFNSVGELVIKRLPQVTFRKSNNVHQRNLILNPPDDKVKMVVWMNYMSEYARYWLVKSWEDSFRLRMIWETEAYVEAGFDAKEGIRRYLDKYDISEDELQLATAYKYWKRHQTKKKTLTVPMLCPII